MARKTAIDVDADAGDGNEAGVAGASPPGGGGSTGEGREGEAAAPDGAGAKEQVLQEILRVVRYLSALADEAKKKRPAGPSRSAFGKLAKVVNAICENAGETREFVEALPRTNAESGGVSGEGELAEGLRACRADFGRWVQGGTAQAVALGRGRDGRRLPGRAPARHPGRARVPDYPGGRPHRRLA